MGDSKKNEEGIEGDESIEIDTDLSAIGCTGVAVGIVLVATEEV